MKHHTVKQAERHVAALHGGVKSGSSSAKERKEPPKADAKDRVPQQQNKGKPISGARAQVDAKVEKVVGKRG